MPTLANVYIRLVCFVHGLLPRLKVYRSPLVPEVSHQRFRCILLCYLARSLNDISILSECKVVPIQFLLRPGSSDFVGPAEAAPLSGESRT